METGCAKSNMPWWRKHRSLIGMCAFAALFCALYAGFLANKSFSPAEGWYSYYAYLINETGAVPYVDFELLFPPLYTYLIACFTRIFGYGILALRIFGVVLYALTGVFACLIFEKLTHNRLLGLLGGLLAVAVLQSEIVQIFYDYIRVMDLFVYISIYFFLRYLERPAQGGKIKIRTDAVVGIVFAVLASLCKQSSGLFFLLFCFAFLAFLLICLPERRKELVWHIGITAAVAVLLYAGMLLFLASKGALSAYISYTTGASVTAKGGSLGAILFGWIPRSWHYLLQGSWRMLIFAVWFVATLWFNRRFPSEKAHPRLKRVATVILPLLLLLCVLLPIFFEAAASFFAWCSDMMFMYATFLLVTLFFALCVCAPFFPKVLGIRDRTAYCKYAFLSGAIFVLAYAVCTSGGLAESQIALGYAFVPVVLIKLAAHRKKELAVAALGLAMLFQTTIALSVKTMQTYFWWGLSTGSAYEQTMECNIPILTGIRVSHQYAAMYNHIYNMVTEYSEPGEEIFVFPHMPVLYLATDRPRATETAIQWFDVSTDEAVIRDIDVLREKKPRVLVLCWVDTPVIKTHEANFRDGQASGLSMMQTTLRALTEREGYERVAYHPLPGGYVMTVWVLPRT